MNEAYNQANQNYQIGQNHQASQNYQAGQSQQFAPPKIQKKRLFSKINPTVLLISVVVLLIVGSTTLKLITPKQIEVPVTDSFTTNINDSTTKFEKVVFSGQKPTVPTNFKIAQAQTNKKPSDIVNNIVDTLALKKNTDIENLWMTEKWFFDYQPQQNLYSLSDLNRKAGELPKGMNETAAVQQANNFMKSYLPGINAVPLKEFIKYYPNGPELYQETTPTQAQIAIIPFAFTIDDLPIFYQKSARFPFEVFIDSQGNFVRLNFFPQSLVLTVVGDKKSLSVDQAIANINEKNLASIIYYQQEKDVPLNLSQIVSANLNQVMVEYRHDEQTGLVYPFYHFTGSAKTKNDTLKIELLTPAIDTISSLQ